MATKVTFTLDAETVRKLENTARRLGKPKSQVVREAILGYEPQSDRLSQEERDRMLGALRTFRALPTTKTSADVERELRELARCDACPVVCTRWIEGAVSRHLGFDWEL